MLDGETESEPVSAAAFVAAGFATVTDNNLTNVKAVLRAFSDVVSLRSTERTNAELETMVDIVVGGLAVPSNGTVTSARMTLGERILGISTDNDDDIEQTVVISLDASMTPTSLVRTEDRDGDGTPDDRREEDTDYDGTLERTVVRSDSDGDGTHERVESVKYSGGVRKTVTVQTDSNDDGTVDEKSTEYYEGSSRLYTYEVTDGTGTEDPADGTADVLEFHRRMDYSGTIDGGRPELVGLGTIVLARGRGETTLKITERGLAELADNAPNYLLRIEGGNNDSVVFWGGIYETGTQLDGSREYKGSSGGTIHVLNGVDVSGTMEPLAAVLLNAGQATIEMFGLASLRGVDDNNIATLRHVIEALVTHAEVPQTALTLTQLQKLVDIFFDGAEGTEDGDDIEESVDGGIRVVPEGGVVVGASVADDVLTLGIDTDADNAVDQQIDLTLDPVTLVPTGIVRKFDVDGDGFLDDREEEDSNYDGTLDRETVRTDIDGDQIHNRIVTEKFEIDSDGDNRKCKSTGDFAAVRADLVRRRLYNTGAWSQT